MTNTPKAEQSGLPDGWKYVAVNEHFDDLMYWLDRCDSKGHLENCADLLEPWSKFEYRNDARELASPVMVNGLTEAETSETMSVAGLAAPAPTSKALDDLAYIVAETVNVSSIEPAHFDRIRAALSAQASIAAEGAEPDTVQLVGVKDGVETVIGTATMPPKMKARELVRETFGPLSGSEDDWNDADMAFGICEQLIDWMQKTPAVFNVTAPVTAARSPLTDAEIEALPVWSPFVGLWPQSRLEIARAIEAAHGIRSQK